MHRQFATTEDVTAECVALTREAGRHLVTVLRLEPGDKVELFDGNGASATFRLSSQEGVQGEESPRPLAARTLLREGMLVLRREGEVRHAAKRQTPLVLAACISKGARMDWTVEKAVELGATRIIPIRSDNCVVSFRNAADAESHRARWRRIATDAARQCGASFIPEIDAPVALDEALAALANARAALFAGGLVPDAIPFRAALDARRAAGTPEAVAWLVGPEGDFSPREYGALRAAGTALVSLGPLVLRTETAAIFGLCVLATEW